MKRYFIEGVQFGESEGGIACGPVGGSEVVTVKYNDSEATHWLSLVDYDGFPNFYLTDEDVHARIVEEDLDDKEFTKYMEDISIYDFDGVSLGGEYVDVFEGLAEDPAKPAVALIRYLINLVSCGEEKVESMIKMATGKFVDDLDIPMSRAELEWLEEQEEEDT